MKPDVTLTNAYGSTIDLRAYPNDVAIRTFCPAFDTDKRFDETRKPTLIHLDPSMGHKLIAHLQAAFPERRKAERRQGGTERRSI